MAAAALKEKHIGSSDEDAESLSHSSTSSSSNIDLEKGSASQHNERTLRHHKRTTSYKSVNNATTADAITRSNTATSQHSRYRHPDTSADILGHGLTPTHSIAPSARPSQRNLRGTGDPEKDGGDDGEDDANLTQAERDYKYKEVEEWNGPDDPENPMNWPRPKKYLTTILYATITFCLTFSSSNFSTAVYVTAKEFHVAPEVMNLGTSIFVFGFATGPLIWGPLSEVYGRKIPLFIGFIGFAIFQIPVAVAQNVETIMLCRYLGGTFGSSALAVIGGTLADFWNPVDRGFALGMFAGATFCGPVAGPIVGGFIVQSYLGWRWVPWITLIMAAFFGTVACIFCQESYVPLILQRRAAKRRHATKNWAIHAPADEHPVTAASIATRYLIRPWAMLVFEPILALVTLYLTFIYGVIYLFFEAYPIAFQEQRGWNLGVGALPFIGLIIGVIIGVGIITYLTKTRYKRKMDENGGKPVPEERLVPMIMGAAILPIGLFWFAWTSSPHITWVPQVIAGVPIGMGIMMIFLQGLSYIIDVYLMTANSALAANTFVRSLAGGSFPLFAVAMYNRLGVAWATSLLAFLCVAFFPVPILFYVYGKKIRQWSRYAVTL